MEETTEAIDADDLAVVRFAPHLRAPNWSPLAEALVWASRVIVVDELLQHTLELAGSEDQQMVEHLPAHSTYPPLGVGVRSRSSEWQSHHLHSVGLEHVVEGITELGVTIVQQVRRREGAVLKVPDEISSLLRHPLTRRVRGDATEMNAAAADLDEEEHVKTAEPGRLHGEEVGREQVRGVLANELLPRSR